jgi:hypothetical protein
MSASISTTFLNFSAGLQALLGVVVFVGDSLTAGYNGADGTFDVTVTAPPHSFLNANPTAIVTNAGVGGWKIDPDMINDGSVHVDPHYDATKPFNIANMWGGTNDLYLANTPPATLLTKLQTWTTARRAVGFKCLVSNCIQRNSLDPAIVSTWNALLISNQSSVADGSIIDLFTIVGTPAQSDGTHISTAQGILVAGAWETAVRGII